MRPLESPKATPTMFESKRRRKRLSLIAIRASSSLRLVVSRTVPTHGVATPWEKEYVRKDATRVPVLVGVALLEGSLEEQIAFCLDLTERKHEELARRRAEESARALQAELSHAARLSTVGEMGIAHRAPAPHHKQSLPPVVADRVQIEQVLLNLILNAAAALEREPSGARVIAIETSIARSGEVEVVVRDHGCGLSPRVSQAMFETFFTTRSSGLGLGLPISRSIVEAHGGRIWAECSAEEGTALHFTLPATGERGATP